MVKSLDTFDIEIGADHINGLAHTSLIKIRQIRSISKKRIRKDK